MRDENIVKKTCSNIEKMNLEIKQNFDIIEKDDILLLDIAIKELIDTRGVIDFYHKEQISSIDWKHISKVML